MCAPDVSDPTFWSPWGDAAQWGPKYTGAVPVNPGSGLNTTLGASPAPAPDAAQGDYSGLPNVPGSPASPLTQDWWRQQSAAMRSKDVEGQVKQLRGLLSPAELPPTMGDAVASADLASTRDRSRAGSYRSALGLAAFGKKPK